jgi:RNA polymerase sigma factor (sigma-70 family)
MRVTADRSAADGSDDRYVLAFRDGLLRRFGGAQRRWGLEVDDIVSYATLELLARLPQVIVRHPDPLVYAAIRFRDVAHDYGRRQAAQRGEGARRTRVVASLDPAHHPERVHAQYSDDALAQGVDDRRRVSTVMSALSARERQVLTMCCAEDLTAEEVARRLGCARETVSRALSRAKRAGAKALGPAS